MVHFQGGFFNLNIKFFSVTLTRILAVQALLACLAYVVSHRGSARRAGACADYRLRHQVRFLFRSKRSEPTC
jgi:hypothetical protein